MRPGGIPFRERVPKECGRIGTGGSPVGEAYRSGPILLAPRYLDVCSPADRMHSRPFSRAYRLTRSDLRKPFTHEWEPALMVEEALDPILIQVTIPLPISMVFSALVEPKALESWLCDSARVTPEVGGVFALTWKEPKGFTSQGKILILHPDVDLEFSWTAPAEFARWMNEPEPRTRVYVRLQESPEGIDVTLEQTGWGSGEAWEAARSWHFHFWDERLQHFKEYLLRTAYG